MSEGQEKQELGFCSESAHLAYLERKNIDDVRENLIADIEKSATRQVA